MRQKLTCYLQAIDVLQKGELVIHQTDTVFGVSGKFDSLKAYDLIYKIKKRSGDKPLAILLEEISQIKLFSDTPLYLLESIFPLLEKGITILLPRKENLPSHLVLQSDYIGLRIPNHEITKKMISGSGPVICTSANLSGFPPITCYEQALPLLDEGVYYLEGGEFKNEIASTILKYENGNYSLIREGNVCKEEVNNHVSLFFKKNLSILNTNS
jgi:L-threonylcarbamoyladenylate synthase